MFREQLDYGGFGTFNDDGNRFGEERNCRPNGDISCRVMWDGSKKYGEAVWFNIIGGVYSHYYFTKEESIDLLGLEISGEEKMLMKLKYGGEWLDEDLFAYAKIPIKIYKLKDIL